MSDNISRRSFLQHASLAAAGLTAAFKYRGSDIDSILRATLDPDAAAPPLEDLVWACVVGEMVTFDPSATNSVPLKSLMPLSYEPLLTYVGGSTTVVPLLAESYELSSDLKVLTLQLRQDVTFSDGTPMTSADVLFTYNRIYNMNGKASYTLAGLTTTAPDEYTVVITSDEPNGGLPALLTPYLLGIMNSTLVMKHGGTDALDAYKTDTATAWLNKNSAGSGKYVLSDLIPATRIAFEPNPAYWGATKPVFKEIVCFGTQSTEEALDLQRGIAQLADDLSYAEAKYVDTSPTSFVPAGLDSIAPAAIRLFFLTFNLRSKFSPSNNADFREAYRYGLDWDAIMALAGPGAVRPAGFLPTLVPGHMPVQDATQRDVDRAKSALARSGLKNPNINLLYPTDTPFQGIEHQTFAEEMQANLEEVGINVDLVGLPNATAFPMMVAGTFDVGLFTTSFVPDPEPYREGMCPGASAENPGGQAGWKVGMNPRVDALSREAQSASLATRYSVFEQLDRAVLEEGPYIVLFQPAYHILYDRRITNVEYSPAYVFDFKTIG
jgi:peptide/nickel transport system substrate-binding protein